MSNFNYMLAPNAEIYQMLAQQNQANRDRAASLGRYGGSGAGAEVNIGDLMGQLSRAQNESSRAEALRNIAARRQRREDITLEREMMEDMAKRKMDFMLQEREMNLQLAAAEEEAQGPLFERLNQLYKDRDDFHAREIKAQAALAERNPQVAKELQSKISEVQTFAKALNDYKSVVHDGFDAELSAHEYMTNPAKGGQVPLSAAQRLVSKTFGGIEFMSEFVTGDKVADAQIGEYLSDLGGTGGGGNLNMASPKLGLVAAAARMKGLPEASQLGILEKLRGEQYQAEANRFAANFLTDLTTKGFVAVGADKGAAEMHLGRIVGQLLDSARSGNTPSQERVNQIDHALEQAAKGIFGEVEGANGKSKLVEALDVMLHKVGELKAPLTKEVGKSKIIGPDVLQNAAGAFAADQANRARNMLRAAIVGKVHTSDQLNSALGKMQGALTADELGRPTLKAGLLPIDEATREAQDLQSIMGTQLVGGVRGLRDLTTSTAKEVEGLTASALSSEQAAREEMMRLMTEGKRTAARAQRAQLRAQREALRNPKAP